MRYIVRYTNPNRVTNPNVEVVYSSKAQVNALVRRARQYPGSYADVEVVKVNAAGVEQHVSV